MKTGASKRNKYEAVVIGVSAGGMSALGMIIPELPPDFDLPVIIVQHRDEDSDTFLSEFLNTKSAVKVKEADEKEKILPGTVYIAPAGYHLLIEEDRTFSLSVDPLINYSRPAIDVLFESAADAYEDQLIGMVLTGSNADGSHGLKKIKNFGGMTLVQDPEEAESDYMPRAAILHCAPDHVLKLQEMAPFLYDMSRQETVLKLTVMIENHHPES